MYADDNALLSDSKEYAKKLGNVSYLCANSAS